MIALFEHLLHEMNYNNSRLKEMAKTMKQQISQEEELALYSNNMGKKSFQWELWQCCNNLCSFCYIGKDNRHTDRERQLKSLADLKKTLSVLDFEKFNNISLIGGEFFQGQLNDPDVKREFMDVIETISKLYVDKKIGSVWVSATLTIGDQKDLYEMLEIFDKAGVRPHPKYGSSGVWICTSWDAQGRFHSEKNQHNWEFHMKNMSDKFPWIKKNTCIILMQRLCEMYLNDEFIPSKFREEFGTELFYKVPGLTQHLLDGIDDLPSMVTCAEQGRIGEYLTAVKNRMETDFGYRFFPDRKTFRKFLLKYAKNDADTFNKLFNIEFRADELHRNFNEANEADDHKRLKNSNRESNTSSESILNPECLLEPMSSKHITNYATYSDCNACMICDRDQIWSSVHG